MVLTGHPLRLGYILVFSATAVVCYAAVFRARGRIGDQDTKWGMVSLLTISGLWSTFHVGRLVVPLPQMKTVFYLLGLSVGLASVGAWLYFCSAYTGQSYHRQRPFRVAAIVIYVSILAVKFTSPIHGLYFSTAPTERPFPHLVIQLGILHWIVTGVAYALSAIGFYMLFDLFADSSYATRRLGLLVGLAGLPVVFDLVGYVSPDLIITLNYEPIGVALFALGVLYTADGTFLAVRRFGREQLIDELDEAIVLLDTEGVVRDVNTAACRLFPALEGSVGRPLSAAAPSVESYLHAEGSRVITVENSDGRRYYLLTKRQLRAGRTSIGTTLVFADITEVERQRREIEYQRDQMDDFAEAITHELRNAANIVRGHLSLVDEAAVGIDDERVSDSVETAVQTIDRMSVIIGDLATLAQYGQMIDETSTVELETVVADVWRSLDTNGCELSTARLGSVEADPPRLERLLSNLLTFHLENGATRVAVEQTDNRLTVTDDETELGAFDPEDALAYGEAVPTAETGMLLPIVRTMAEAHGWTVSVDPDYADGVRVRVQW